MKNKGFVDSIIAKIINNFQVTVKNIHIRYEDNVSVAGVSGRALMAPGRSLTEFHI
jgi:Vacuolar sorting-associated protein 13, N-terminal